MGGQLLGREFHRDAQRLLQAGRRGQGIAETVLHFEIVFEGFGGERALHRVDAPVRTQSALLQGELLEFERGLSRPAVVKNSGGYEIERIAGDLADQTDLPVIFDASGWR